MIKINNLQKNYGELEVLKNINLNIEEGDIYGLVGKSGAGKSTLLRCLNGLTSYNDGSLIIDNKEVKNLHGKKLREFRKEIGMVFQHFSLLERKSVYDNIAYPMKCWDYSRVEIDRKVKELVDLVGIPDKIYEKPRNLSGGQKQRVAIARALTLNPKILLCDEATSALDPKTTKSILALLRKINKKLGITIVVVTHQMSVVRQICNKVSILEKGRISEQGYVKDIFLRQSDALKKFIGDDDLELSDSGKNIQVIWQDKSKDRAIFTQMAVDLGITFPILDGSVLKYGDDLLSSFIINIKDEHYNKVIFYLESKDITWLDVKNSKGELSYEEL
ncbi:methionine ABC transporter ATP-binding protein [Terrisporobacter vanillatitrophus]|uniref:methionine ABC transporter ATP-binding protein n=1 Tax=Terrisporobacter vanillatitrophus TaxID=3058402 RepID=UPI00336898F4